MDWQDAIRPAHHQAVSAYAPEPVRSFAVVLVHRGARRLLPCGHAVLVGALGRHKRLYDDHSRSTGRSEEHTSELQSLMRISYAVFCLKKKNKNNKNTIEADEVY